MEKYNDEQQRVSYTRRALLTIALSKKAEYPDLLDAIGHVVDAIIKAVYKIKAAVAPNADTSELDDVVAIIQKIKDENPMPAGNPE